MLPEQSETRYLIDLRLQFFVLHFHFPIYSFNVMCLHFDYFNSAHLIEISGKDVIAQLTQVTLACCLSYAIINNYLLRDFSCEIFFPKLVLISFMGRLA